MSVHGCGCVGGGGAWECSISYSVINHQLLRVSVELPWDVPTSECAEYREWHSHNYFFSPWTKISNEPLGKDFNDYD